MRPKTRSALIAILALAPASIAWTGHTDGVLTLVPESRLWVDGTSTVRSFTCAAAVIEADVTTTTDGAASAVAAGEKAVASVVLRVPAANLDCKNGKMNEHMLKALKATENPVITYTVTSYELARTDADIQATLTGSLSLGGVERPMVVVATAKDEGGLLRITGTQKVTMSEFGLKPPTLMMGTLKVRDAVTVGFDLLLKN